MKKAVAFFLTIAVLAGAGGSYYHFVYKKNHSSAKGRVSSTADNAVFVTKVSEATGLGSGTGLIQRYGGMVVPQETWEAKLESDRSVKETYVKVGDLVKAGDKLFTYDTSEDQDKIAQDEIDIERSQNDIKNSEATLANLEKQLASAKEADKASIENLILSEKNSIKQAEYDIKSKNLQIESLKSGMENADVVSKIEGVIKSITNPDSNTSSYGDSSDAYITVMATGDLRVEGKVNEQNIRNIYEGAEVICFSRVDSSQYWLGSIAQIKRDGGTQTSSDNDYSDSSDSSGSTNYPFYIKLENSDNLILGQHLYIEMNEGQLNHRDGMWLPEYYLTKEEDGSVWVWAASAKDTLEKRTVKLGEYNEAEMTYEVLEGLSAEDYIAVPDDRYAEGDPLIFNEDGNSMDETEDVFDVDDLYGGSFDEVTIDDGSYNDFYFDEGSFDWEDADDELGSVYVLDDDETTETEEE